MAFVTQDDKKKLAPQIKAVLKTYGVKASISITNMSTLVVTLKSGSIDLLTDYNERLAHERTLRGIEVMYRETYELQHPVSPTDIAGLHAEFFTALIMAMRGTDWFDKSDMQTDYFNTKHYTQIRVGTYDKPYTLTN